MEKSLFVRKAEQADLPRILEIYELARDFMRRSGNPTQWGSSYPDEDLLREDLAAGRLYAVVRGEDVAGVFMFAIGPDETYTIIEDGAWHGSSLYGTIHRIAGDGTGGVFAAAVAFCRTQIAYLRIDTHENNKVMQHLVEKAGFRRCGIIYTDDGTPRIAYDRI